MQAEGWDKDQNSFSFAYAHYLGTCWKLTSRESVANNLQAYARYSAARPLPELLAALLSCYGDSSRQL